MSPTTEGNTCENNTFMNAMPYKIDLTCNNIDSRYKALEKLDRKMDTYEKEFK
ncbi:hypothetical protein DPMN_178690 [Dreissena polymorpha]|uniref:Uncharacterized protein n=1 Tax=Dreissena polymorpha TaxID=45954 RepID=A0A9D4EDB4_DREPO|nr:hypothetical protein DPMN_178690 [Dreissena polymorpha]